MNIQLSADRCRQELTEHAAGLAKVAAAVEPDADVPTCADWNAAELVEHLGQTYNWVAEIVEQRISDPMQLPTTQVPAPADHADWPDWLTESAQRAATACSDQALTADVFNPAGDDRSGAQFWLHSLLNESVVHGADGAATAGQDYHVDPDVAVELITNHLRMITSAGWAMNVPESAQALRGSGETLLLVADEAARLGESATWFIERGPEDVGWQHGEATADVTVRGPAGALLLVLTRRLRLSQAQQEHGVQVEGAEALITHWVDNTAHIGG